MEAWSRPEDSTHPSPDDTMPTWVGSTLDAVPLESGPRLASERPTLPPTGASAGEEEDVVLSHFHLGPSVDEVLYRLSLGDYVGAALANADLEGCVPARCLVPAVIGAMQLAYLEEYMLSAVDGRLTWGDILDASPFSPKDSLKALCDLVDKGAVTLGR